VNFNIYESEKKSLNTVSSYLKTVALESQKCYAGSREDVAPGVPT